MQVSAEELLQQLAAVQAGQTGGLSSDALTQAILERLNEEVARVYAEASADGGDQLPGDGPVSPAKSSASRLDSSRADNRPKPVDLWKAAHEVDRAPKEVRTVRWECSAVDTVDVGNCATAATCIRRKLLFCSLCPGYARRRTQYPCLHPIYALERLSSDVCRK